MNANEARDQAINALSIRLRGWGIDSPEIKARDYIAGLQRAGWVWAHPENRPQPPKPDEACATCGMHLDKCLGGHPTSSRSARANRTTDPTPYIEQARAALRCMSAPDTAATTTETDPVSDYRPETDPSSTATPVGPQNGETR